jgi:hypothetical protein
MVPGDEITCDYGSDYFDLFIAPDELPVRHVRRDEIDAPMLAKDSKRAHGRIFGTRLILPQPLLTEAPASCWVIRGARFER